jgi:protein-L-isoaspartate(D-aspartate) O-methyltransferase
MMTDSYRHKGLRKKLVERLQAGHPVRFEERILEAIGKIPRHLFLDSSFVEYAYEDKAFPIGYGQTISQPSTVAFQTQLLQVNKGDKVLEVGTGSGYQACVLLELEAKVFSIERQKNLYLRTKDLLPKLNYHPKLFFGDGYLGLPAFAPFDRILVTAAAPSIPGALIEQLKPGGRLVIPAGKPGAQVMTLVTKPENGPVEMKEYGEFRFVPMLQKKEHHT